MGNYKDLLSNDPSMKARMEALKRASSGLLSQPQPLKPNLHTSTYLTEELRAFRNFYNELINAGWLKMLETSLKHDKSVPEGEIKEYGLRLTELIKKEKDIKQIREYYYAIKWLLRFINKNM